MPQFNQLQIYQGNVIWERGQVLAASEAEAAIDSITEKAATKRSPFLAISISIIGSKPGSIFSANDLNCSAKGLDWAQSWAGRTHAQKKKEREIVP